jgi:hypothetical protein
VKLALAGGLSAALLLVGPGLAAARTHIVVSYPYDAVYAGAIRFIRVDRNWKLVEQDKEAGFLRFELVEDKKPHAANLELIRTSDGEGRPAVRVQLSTADLARFQEAPILDALARKLREELGPPPAPPPRKSEPASPSHPDAASG